MKRLLSGLALALLIVTPAIAKAAVTPSLEILNPTPYHYGDVLSVIVHGDVPGSPGDTKPKAQLRLDCDYGGAFAYSETIYSPQEETVLSIHLGLAPSGAGLSNWDVDGGGAADCVLQVYQTRYHGFAYDIIEVWDTESFHVEA